MKVRTILSTVLFALLTTQVSAVSGGGFSLSVQNRADDHRGYVRMDHGAVYSLCFRSDIGRAADAEVSIDGLPMGTWRLSPRRSACIDRPADDTGQFTFYRADSADGYAVGSAQVGRSDKGRVSVRFIPEVERTYPVPTPYFPQSRSAPEQEMFAEDSISGAARSYAAPHTQRSKTSPPRDRLGAGVTGLTGESDQRFGTAKSIKRDYAAAVILELRLVHDPAMDRPADPRPLPGRYDRLAPPPI